MTNWEFICKTLRDLVTRCTSRKFIAFCVATVLLWFNYIAGEQWIMIAMLYVGTQGGIDYVKQRNSSTEPKDHFMQ